MARYEASLHAPLGIEEVFAYLSDFSTTKEWDPGVAEAVPLQEGEVRVGSEFRLTATFLGRTVPLTYEVVECHPPLVVGFRGENATAISRDRIVLEPAGEGTRISYRAELKLKGLARVADPLLAIAFNRTGDRALASLSETLGARAAERAVQWG